MALKSDFKRQDLEKRKVSLLEEIEAVSDQIDSTLSAVDRVRLERQKENLFQKLDRLESQFETLNAESEAELLGDCQKPKQKPIPHELDSDMYFRIPELRNEKIAVDPELQPILIITSNSEKDLPDAFLRRCVYYNVPFPERNRLEEIVAKRLQLSVGDRSPFLQPILDLFDRLRSPQSGLRQKPSTAELLSWLLTLQSLGYDRNSPLIPKEVLLQTLSSLVKTAEDQEIARKIVSQWIQK